MRITLKNDFHNRKVQINAEAIEGQDGSYTIILTKRQAQRTKRLLCGIESCVCSNNAGTRGAQAGQNQEKIALILTKEV